MAKGPGWPTVCICPRQKEVSSVPRVSPRKLRMQVHTEPCTGDPDVLQGEVLVTQAYDSGTAAQREQPPPTLTHSSDAFQRSQTKRPPGCSPSICESRKEPNHCSRRSAGLSWMGWTGRHGRTTLRQGSHRSTNNSVSCNR